MERWFDAPVAVIVNPVSGHGRVRRWWPQIAAALKAQGLAFAAVWTPGPGAATWLTRQALAEGAELVVAVGGDGTLNEVVNGFLADDRPVNPRARLGLIPTGTGTDFSRSLGLPVGLAAVPALTAGRVRYLDVGRASFRAPDGRPAHRYFVNVADAGLGATVAALVGTRLKALGGRLAYLTGVVLGLLRHRDWWAEYRIDDGPWQSGLLGMVAVANGRYHAGGMLLAPPAALDDGYLDLLLLRGARKTEVVGQLLPRVYRGAHLGHPKVTHARLRRLVLRSPERVGLELDGEVVGFLPAEFTVVPQVLALLG